MYNPPFYFLEEKCTLNFSLVSSSNNYNNTLYFDNSNPIRNVIAATIRSVITLMIQFYMLRTVFSAVNLLLEGRADIVFNKTKLI